MVDYSTDAFHTTRFKEVASDAAYDVVLSTDQATGIVVTETWYIDNTISRSGRPARIERDPRNGEVIREEWRKHDLLHNADGAAVLVFDPTTGIAIMEEWRQAGKLHRLDGPALIHRTPLGTVISAQWWVDGRERVSTAAIFHDVPL